MKSPKEINKANAEFWEKQNSETDLMLSNPATAERIFSALQSEAKCELYKLTGMEPQEAINACIKASSFMPGRQNGAVGKKQIHVNELVNNNPGMTAKELRKIADDTILGNIAEGTFANKVVEAHKKK
ncbi:MAG: hypothetical protein V4570_00175 [Pseudomonadota bacterium]